MISKLRMVDVKKILFGAIGIMILFLNFWMMPISKTEAACGVVCGQVNTVGGVSSALDPLANCKYDFSDPAPANTVCVVNIAAPGGIVTKNALCADNSSMNACSTTCPSNLTVANGAGATNGASCTIMSSQFSGTCISKQFTFDGKWDASEGKCVKCAGQMEDRVYNVSGGTFSDTDIVNRCESACGGPASRDEQATCVVAACAINPPTIVSIDPATYSGPAGGFKVYTIKVMNNNTDCGPYSVHFTAFLDGDLTADWVLGGSTGVIAEGGIGTTTITITAKATATPGTKDFKIYAFPHDDIANIDYSLKSTNATASYIIGAPPPETCNDPAVADEDGNGLANCADTAACPIGVKCEGGGICQADTVGPFNVCVLLPTTSCSGTAMFTSILGDNCLIRDVLTDVISWVLALTIGLLLLIVIISAIKYITSAGDEEKLRSAKNMLFYAILGFAIILIAYELINAVPGLL